MRKIYVGASIAALALLGAGAAYLALLDVNQFRPQIQAAIQKQLGRPVSLGTMALRIVPLSIRIANVRIAEDPTFKTGLPFATAEQVSVAVDLLPLLRNQLQISSFVLRQPAIELVRDRAGKWNFSSLGGGKGGSGAGPSIAELRVENGRVAVSDLGKRRSVYDRIDISLADFQPGRPFRLTLAAALPGSRNGSLRMEGSAGPLGSQQAPVAGRIEVRKADFAALRQFLSASAAQTGGIIDGTVDFESKDSAVSVRPHLAISKIRLNGKDLGRGLRIDGDLQHDLNSGLLRIAGFRLVAGDIPVAISGEADTRKSRIDVTARMNGAPVADLLGAAAALGGTGLSGSGRLTLDVRVRGPLDRMSELEYFGQGTLRDAAFQLSSLNQPLQVRSANLKLSGKKADLDGVVCSLGKSNMRGSMTVTDFAAPAAGFNIEIDRLDVAEIQKMVVSGSGKEKSTGPASTLKAQGTLKVGTLSYADLVLKQVRSECSFAGGLLTLAPLTAEVFSGTQTGGITVDFRSEPATVAIKTKLEAVDANQLLSATTSLKQALFGLLAASGNASLKLLPGTAAARTMNGDLSIRLTKGRLGGINLMNELASLGKFIGFASKAQPFTDVVSLTGDVQVRDGVARSDNLLVQMDGGSVAAAGTVNLADEALNLRVTAILGREASQKAGGSRIGGYLTTALVNSNGELVIPALVTGTFNKPRFAPDAARVAEMKLKNVLPGTGSAGSAVSGVAGLITGEKGAGKSILQSITGKQAESPKPAEGTQATSAPPADQTPKRKGLLGALETLRKKTQQQPTPAQPATPR